MVDAEQKLGKEEKLRQYGISLRCKIIITLENMSRIKFSRNWNNKDLRPIIINFEHPVPPPERNTSDKISQKCFSAWIDKISIVS